MTPKVQAELLTKCRRLFYNKVTGLVLGVSSGGGGLESLTGDALIIATHNDPGAPDTIGCIECFFLPVGQGRASSVNLALVGTMESTSKAYHSNPSDQNAQALCDARDAAVTFAVPRRVRS